MINHELSSISFISLPKRCIDGGETFTVPSFASSTGDQVIDDNFNVQDHFRNNARFELIHLKRDSIAHEYKLWEMYLEACQEKTKLRSILEDQLNSLDQKNAELLKQLEEIPTTRITRIKKELRSNFIE